MMTYRSTTHFPVPQCSHSVAKWPWWCDADAANAPSRFLLRCPAYRPTPLFAFSALAAELRLTGLYGKDETSRLGLGSFKALGGFYAVLRVAQRRAEAHLGRPVATGELRSSLVLDAARGLTVCCASDGNHGRSVAAGARLLGADCFVFLHEGVSSERAAHIEQFGASVVRVEGSYDDSVAAAARTAAENGWTLVADVADPRDQAAAELCGYVMQGYTILVAEVLSQARDQGIAFTHVVVQAGVGGLAASVFGHWTAVEGEAGRPRFIVVEPEAAACLLESARAGRVVPVPRGQPTVMAMLECQTPSPMAWPVVSRLADAYITVSDADARAAVSRLANPIGTDPPVHVGESGAAGLAGLIRLVENPAWRSRLDLDDRATVLMLLTEGPTDRSVWSGRDLSNLVISA